MGIDINNEKIQEIELQDVSLRYTKNIKLPVQWKNENCDIRWNNMIAMAVAISRGIDKNKLIQNISDTGEIDTTGNNLSGNIITNVREVSKILYPIPRSMTDTTLQVNWTNDAKATGKKNGTLKHSNQYVYGITVARGIDTDIESFNFHIDDVAAWTGIENNQLARIQMLGSAGNRKGLFYINRSKIQNPVMSDFVQVGSFNKKFSSIALAFDGQQSIVGQDNNELVDNFTGYKLATEDLLWIFYINDNKLYAQKGLWGSSILLADDAIEVVAERGYQSNKDGTTFLDQGLIVAYLSTSGFIRLFSQIKESKEISPRWIRQDDIKGLPKPGVSLSDTTISDEEKYDILYIQNRPITLQIHRLNDYRIGIEVTFKKDNKQQTIWHITDRFYSSMGFTPEQFQIPVIQSYNIQIGISTNNELVVQPEFFWTYDNEVTIILVSNFDFKIWNNYDLMKSFSISSGVVRIKDIQLVDNKTIIITLNEPAQANFIVKITQNIDFSVQRNLNNQYSQVMVHTQEHLFEVAIKYKYIEKDIFEIPMIQLAEGFCLQVNYKTFENYNFEEKDIFEIPMIQLAEGFSLQMKQKSGGSV